MVASTNWVAPGSTVVLLRIAAADCACCLLFCRVAMNSRNCFVFFTVSYLHASKQQRSNDVRNFIQLQKMYFSSKEIEILSNFDSDYSLNDIVKYFVERSQSHKFIKRWGIALGMHPNQPWTMQLSFTRVFYEDILWPTLDKLNLTWQGHTWHDCRSHPIWRERNPTSMNSAHFYNKGPKSIFWAARWLSQI